MAIAHSAQETRSPVDSSMSISRGSGTGETSCASAMSRSVSLPRADSTATTRCPASALATMRAAAFLIRSASATEVPPNFMTMVGARSGMGWTGYERRGQRDDCAAPGRTMHRIPMCEVAVSIASPWRAAGR